MNTFDSFAYSFPALRGIQAGKEFYVIMCPLKLVPKLFMFDGEELDPKFRAQRTLNRSRLPEITNYLLNNSTDYVFSSITASVDSQVQFEPASDNMEQIRLGTLKIPMSAQLIINDGQHRRAAIEEAIKLNRELGDETISVVLFIDAGLRRSQQMFSDLNKHAIRPTKSLSILYDHRDEFARFILEMIPKVPVFNGLVELEKTTISNRSTKLFTLSSIYLATSELLNKKKKIKHLSKDEKNKTILFWTEVGKNIPEWNLVVERKAQSSDLRKDYVHSHSVILHAMGLAGHSLLMTYPTSWEKKLRKLRNIDWSRSNSSVWEGRATIGGKISKARTNLILTANYLKQVLGLKLSLEEKKIENSLIKNQGTHDV